MPTDEQIATLLDLRRPDWWTCRGCGARIDARTGGDPSSTTSATATWSTAPTTRSAARHEPQPSPAAGGATRSPGAQPVHRPPPAASRRAGRLDTVAGVVTHATDVGFLLWVPDDPDQSAKIMIDPVPDVVLAIQHYARMRDCGYVLFDADAEQVNDLPTWDW